MKQRYLEVTYRKGKTLAAYLYLPRAAGARAAETVDAGRGVLIDLDEQGRVIGVEITSPTAISLRELNAILVKHGIQKLDAEEAAPLAA